MDLCSDEVAVIPTYCRSDGCRFEFCLDVGKDLRLFDCNAVFKMKQRKGSATKPKPFFMYKANECLSPRLGGLCHKNRAETLRRSVTNNNVTDKSTSRKPLRLSNAKINVFSRQKKIPSH
jgi:hypothetical protein